MANLSRSVVLNILGVNKDAKAAIDDINKQADALAARKTDINVGADTSAASSAIAKVMGELEALRNGVHGATATFKFDADTSAVTEKLAGMQALVNRLSSEPHGITVTLDDGRAISEMTDLSTRLNVLSHQIASPHIDINYQQALSEIQAVKSALAGIESRTVGVGVIGGGNADAAVQAEAQVAAEAERLRGELAAVQNQADKTFLAIKNGGDGSGGVFSRLVAGAGGAGAGLANMGILGLSAFHLIAAGSVELLAVTIPALLALGAYGIYAAKWIGNIGDQFKNLQIVTKATNSYLHETTASALGLGNSFQQLQTKIEPTVYSALGGGLITIRESMRSMSPVVQGMGQVFDNFFAKLAIDARTQQFSNFMQFAVHDAQGLGQVLGNLGHAVLNVLGDFPHFAEVLLAVATAASRLIEAVSKIPAPILTTVLALHELNTWGTFAVNGLSKMGIASDVGKAKFLSLSQAGLVLANLGNAPIRMLGTLGSGIASAAGKAVDMGAGKLPILGAALTGVSRSGGLFSNIASAGAAALGPWGKAALVVGAALGVLIAWLVTAKSAATQFVDTTLQGITKLNDSQQFQGYTNAIHDFTIKAREAEAQSVKTTMATMGLSKSAAEAQSKYYSFNPAIQQARENLATYEAAIKTAETQQGELEGSAARLANKYGVSLPQAYGLAQAAGVNLAADIQKQGGITAQDEQKIADLVAGYKAMGIQAGTLGNSIIALDGQINIQDSKVQQLNQAWDQMIQLSSNVENSTVQIFQSMQNIGKGTLSASNGTQGLKDQLQQLTTVPVGANLNGIDAASLSLRSNFQQLVSQSQGLFDNLRTGMAATGAGTASFKQMQAAGATLGLQLLSMSNGSQLAQGQVRLLAQQIGYTGNTSLASLVKWLDQTAGPLTGFGKQSVTSQQVSQNLNNVLQNQAARFTNLTAVAKQYSNTLQSNYVNAVTNSITKSAGWESALTNLTGALSRTRALTPQVTQAAQQFAQQSIRAGQSTDTVRAALLSEAHSFGISGAAANNFANSILRSVSAHNNAKNASTQTKNAIDNEGRSADQARIKFVGLGNEAGGHTSAGHRVLSGNANQTKGAIDNVGRSADAARGKLFNLGNEAGGHASAGHRSLQGNIAMAKSSADLSSASYDKSRSKAADMGNEAGGHASAGHRTLKAAVDGSRASVDLFSTSADKSRSKLADFGNEAAGHATASHKELKAATDNTRASFDSFSVSTDKSRSKSSDLGNTLNGQTTPAHRQLKSATDETRAAYDAFSSSAERNTSTLDRNHNTYNSLHGEVTSFTNAIRQLTAATDSAASSNSNLFNKLGQVINQVRSLKTAIDQMTQSWNNARNATDAYPKVTNAKLNASGSGNFTFSVSQSNTPGHAAGVLVPGSGSGDIVPAMLTPGEAVVPKHLVPHIAPFLAANNVPGFTRAATNTDNAAYNMGHFAPAHDTSYVKHFASGGAAKSFSGNESPSDTNSFMLGQITNFFKYSENAFGNAAESAIKSAIASAKAAALAALAGAGPAANFSSGSELANGRSIFQYLLANLFGGNKIAAAGAIASIWGESTWNPEAAGTGGNGLIGWTPARSGYVTGNPTRDLNFQLPQIINFVHQSGDLGAIAAMERSGSVLDAANIWGKQVERYGINDVHPQGVSLATAIMNGARNGGVINEPILGVGLHTGQTWSMGEDGPEWISPMPGGFQGGGGGDTHFHIAVAGDTDPNAAALRIYQKLRDYMRLHGMKNLVL